MVAALKLNWLGRLGARRGAVRMAPVPLMPSRDLPPLPRSPEPMPDEALVFAQGAARRPLQLVETTGGDDTVPASSAMPVATGADLRAMLERFERAQSRRQALSQAADARSRLVERLAAGKAAAGQPALRLVGADGALPEACAAAAEARRIDRAMEEALESALGTLKRISMLTRD